MMLRTGLALLAVVLQLLYPPPTASSAGRDLASCRRGPATVLAPSRNRALACSVAERASKLHAEITRNLALREQAEVSVVLATPHLRPQDSPVDPGSLPPWLGGLALSRERTILIRVQPGRTAADHDELLAHELTHVLISAEYPSSAAWPRWFHEALAMRQSGEGGLRMRAALSLAATRGRLLPFDILWASFPEDQPGSRLAYAQSFSVLSYLVARHGQEAFASFLDLLRREGFEEAFEESFGYSLAAMERGWRRDVNVRYSWVPLATGGTAFWLLVLALFFLALAIRRRRSRELHRQWEEEESRELG